MILRFYVKPLRESKNTLDRSLTSTDSKIRREVVGTTDFGEISSDSR